jgi:hypothetical protein
VELDKRGLCGFGYKISSVLPATPLPFKPISTDFFDPPQSLYGLHDIRPASRYGSGHIGRRSGPVRNNLSQPMGLVRFAGLQNDEPVAGRRHVRGSWACDLVGGKLGDPLAIGRVRNRSGYPARRRDSAVARPHEPFLRSILNGDREVYHYSKCVIVSGAVALS